MKVEKYSIGKYNYKEDKEYLDYLEREKKESHMRIYDDAYDNNNEENTRKRDDDKSGKI